MYAKSGSIEEARAVFDCMPDRDTVSWNTLLVGYAQREQGHPALELFHKSQKEGIKADCFTLSCVLKSCVIVGALWHGELLHSQIYESNFEADLVLTSTLVDLYASCGSMEDAKKMFMSSQDRDMALWNAMIGGYAQHGLCDSVLQCLADMRERGVNPGSRTYINALAACSHRGDISGGWKLFRLMKEEQKIDLSIEHFNAMIDLLGHCGCLDEAKELLHLMPLSPNVTSWLTLLYSCRLHDSKELAEECFSEAVCLDSNVASGYVLMANVYANLNKWEDANKLLKLRKYAEAQKKLGTSWIEVNKTVHEFVIGLSVHPQIGEVHSKFKSLQVLLKLSNYIPQSGLVLEQGAFMGAYYDRPVVRLGLSSSTECTTIRVSFVHQQFIHPVNWIKMLQRNTRHPIHVLTKYCFY
ncbi:hypothetical protein L7F22_053420 [Adiantum nelumboides]|nr:hypothetical protein [Adiantum nelumboides]